MKHTGLKKIGFLFTVLFGIMSSAQNSEMADMVTEFEADNWALRRTYIVDESEEYYQRYTKHYSDWNDKLDKVDFNAMSQQGKVDYVLLKNLVNKRAYLLGLDYDEFKEVDKVGDFGKDIFRFMQERRRGKRPDAKLLSQQFQDASDKIDAEIEAWKAKPFKDWQTADKASDVISSFQKGLKESYEFYYGYDPEFTWWVEKPYEKLNEKLTAYAEFLKENYSEGSVKDDGSGIIGKPIGEAALKESLALEFIPYTPAQLIKTAEEQFAWCKSEMIKASRELGYGDDWKKALEHVKNTYVPAGDQPQAIFDLYQHSVDFIEERDLITLPELAKETWGMKMMSAERQKVSPFFLGGPDIIISYPTLEMNHNDKLMSMRGNNPNFSFPTVQHELLPGHNLQHFMTSRHKSYRRPFYNPFWTEGWSLYWEIILWNKEFPQTPEQKLGMLFWRIHRCARIIFSLKFHLGEMTPQECIDLLVDEVGHEYANAEAEVRRSFTTSYPPLYQLAYMMGGLQFYALRKEMLDKGWTEKEFHDRVMVEGRMPVEILRSLLQELPLNKNYKTQWKFATDFK
ncbi:DUF885 family protein [Flagellimonas zhangzhouensis]|uniref:Uncharacterized conserved protein, DUF885 familyt n=1 Tax=Flagellimonas zhangzhouensis TaxID=1073328 RepID=A0A1H2WK01_9FLAO|nr:DUF885 family protein [Allomuricauda zhangzhouensis]SDQ22058.1 Uncharacterized conserved protein, DUF885 familyt [Allomuricauda zhangzhouensis]SDW80838.1 Uncharacterized conserved protein, DUF885 familyt [Allomuricauda zhangzhouensis]